MCVYVCVHVCLCDSLLKFSPLGLRQFMDLTKTEYANIHSRQCSVSITIYYTHFHDLGKLSSRFLVDTCSSISNEVLVISCWN